MQAPDVLSLALQEQERARAIVAGLGPCPVLLSRATTQLGAFRVDRRTGAIEIRVSRHLRDEGQVRDTIRHELAHQAAWERYEHIGHGPLWKTFASYLGCAPVSCAALGVDPTVVESRQRWAVSCRRCGWETTRQRRSKLVAKPRRFACARCRGPLRVAPLVAPA